MTTRTPATFIAVASLLLTLGGCGQGSDSMHPAPMTIPEAASAMTEASYREAVKTLSSDEFGGRAPASPGEELTVNFLVDAFKSLGLQGANNGDYVQAVPLSLVMVNNDPALTIQGGFSEPMSLAYGDDQILFTRRQGAKPVESSTAWYQWLAQTPSLARRPGGQLVIASAMKSTPNCSHSWPSTPAGSRNTSSESITAGRCPVIAVISSNSSS